LEQLEEKLRGLAAPKDYGLVLQDVSRQVREDTRDRFNREVDPDGASWAELAESTIEKKGHDVRLFETGALLLSLGNVEEITTDSLECGTDDEKAGWHQNGTKDGHVPARPFVGFNERGMQSIEDQVADFVEEEVARAFDGLA
jgi:phage virion morphogenesis protein